MTGHMTQRFSLLPVQDFAEEQGLVARLIHQLRAEDTDDTFSVLRSAHERMQGSGDLRLKHTLPAIAFCGLQLIPEIKARENAGEKAEVTCKQVRVWLPATAAIRISGVLNHMLHNKE